MREAYAEYGVGVVYLEAPYDEDFIEDLKAAIPAPHRRWNASGKVWEISEEYWPQASEVVENYFALLG